MKNAETQLPFTIHSLYVKFKKSIHTLNGLNTSMLYCRRNCQLMKMRWLWSACHRSLKIWVTCWKPPPNVRSPTIWCGVWQLFHRSSSRSSYVNDNWSTALLWAANKNRSHGGRNVLISLAAGKVIFGIENSLQRKISHFVRFNIQFVDCGRCFVRAKTFPNWLKGNRPGNGERHSQRVRSHFIRSQLDGRANTQISTR